MLLIFWTFNCFHWFAVYSLGIHQTETLTWYSIIIFLSAVIVILFMLCFGSIVNAKVATHDYYTEKISEFKIKLDEAQKLAKQREDNEMRMKATAEKEKALKEKAIFEKQKVVDVQRRETERYERLANAAGLDHVQSTNQGYDTGRSVGFNTERQLLDADIQKSNHATNYGRIEAPRGQASINADPHANVNTGYHQPPIQRKQTMEMNVQTDLDNNHMNNLNMNNQVSHNLRTSQPTAHAPQGEIYTQ